MGKLDKIGVKSRQMEGSSRYLSHVTIYSVLVPEEKPESG